MIYFLILIFTTSALYIFKINIFAKKSFLLTFIREINCHNTLLLKFYLIFFHSLGNHLKN